ncbi:MAG: glycoside hydrolase family 2 protein [Humibacillus sp.]|nr:glycoside hydrolase family 2 protein [Humibacillus sp.]MDN5775820.1 glycoside hydrolase family 2 protein [Humibacillus sp.]
MSSMAISQGWTLTLRSGRGPDGTAVAVPDGIPDHVPAEVPGCVHTDLLAAGLIPDPYVGCNEQQVQWIGETDARYRTSFAFVDEGHERVDLVAEGLDTAATVSLNGAVVGRTKNQHRTYRFDVRALLSPGNQLVVDLDAPLRAARESEQRIGVKPLVGDALPYNALRKMASNFGWDWGPTLTTAGIWRPIRLQQWSTARLASVVPTVTVDERGRGRVTLSVDLERTGEQDVTLDALLTAPDGTTTSATATTTHDAAELSFTVDEPELWWPRGHGEQPLYRLVVRASAGGVELDAWSHDMGFRTVEVRVEPDEHGTSFEFHVNGEFVWVKGANWIPGDCFPSRMTPQDYERAVQGAADAGMNLLRAWGGGIYESDDFYDACNRQGILVWQDFQFACACYSEAPEMWQEVEAEAREHVARLAANPSLALWSGGNENIEGYYTWGFKERLAQGEGWGGRYYDELFPAIIDEIDPGRAYIPSSPWSPNDESHPTLPDHGPVHSWKVWFSVDYLEYRSAIPRFVAEFGFQAPANHATLMPAIHDEHPAPESPGMLNHQKAIDGNLKLERGWVGHVPTPAGFDDWYFTTQLDQARAISCAVSHYRSHAPRNAGYIVWQLNDCWPAISWAVIDSGGRRKPLWYALRRLNAPRVLLLQPREGGVALIVSNDSAQPWCDTVEVRRTNLAGETLASEQVAIDVAPRSGATTVLASPLQAPVDASQELLVASCSSASDAGRAWWWFVEDLDLRFLAPSLRTDVRRSEQGYGVVVTADALVKDLVLSVDRLDPSAIVSDQLVTLLPGESYTFSVTSTADLDPAALTSPPVLMSVNHRAHPRSEAVSA